jgi:undecaprenyl-diphosphatase
LSYIDAIILGAIQGLTEFLPVSSSGHLVLVQSLLDVKQPGVSFEVLLHLATLAAVLVYFRQPIGTLMRATINRSMPAERRMIGYLFLATVPAVVVGGLLMGPIREAFSNPLFAAAMLLVTGLILLASGFIKPGTARVGSMSALRMGLGQALAILPGISRSGTTIVAGIQAGIQPSQAAEFSFLLAIPAIGGAAILDLKNLVQIDAALWGQYLAGMAVAFVLALVACHLVMVVVKKGRFSWFAYYCFAAGGLGLYLFM